MNMQTTFGHTLVVGGASGIGRAVAIQLAPRCDSLIVLDRDEVALESLSHVLPGARMMQREMNDLTSSDDMVVLLSECDAHFDSAVYVPGVSASVGAGEVSWETWRHTFHINVEVPFFLFREILKRSTRECPVSVAAISSDHAVFIRRLADYSSSKAALEMAMRELAVWSAARGGRVNVIRPGAILSGTGIPKSAEEARRAALVLPTGKLGDAVDVARAVEFVLDKSNSYLTGAAIAIDGGLSLHSWSSDLGEQL